MIGIVITEFYPELNERLLSGCKKGLEENGFDMSELKIVSVPGAFEIPFACNKLADESDVKCIITLGVVIRGQTQHFDMINKACTDGVMKVMLDKKIPIVFEVLMVENKEQAMIRSNMEDLSKNKGYIAAETAHKMLNLKT